MAKYIGSAGDAKSTRLVEQRIQQLILSHANGNTNGSSLGTQLAEYLRVVFGVDICLLYSQNQEQGIVAIEGNCSSYPRSILMPLLDQLLAQPQFRERKIAEVVEINNLEGLEICQLPSSPQTSFQNMVSLLSLETEGEGLVLLGRNQGNRLGNRSGNSTWVKGQKNLLKNLGTLLAIALALGCKIQQTHQQLDISYPYQKLTNQITQTIRDHQEISQILKQAITATSQTLKANAGLVLLLKHKDMTWKKAEANSLKMIQVTTAAQWAIPGYEQQLFPSQSAFWVSTSPLCSQALQQAPQPLIIKENSVLVMFPLMGAAGKSLPGKVLGFLVLEYSPTRQLLPGELELISSVSNQLSYALIQDQTLRQVKAIVDERTAQLQVSLEVQGRLYEKIRHQVDQLRQLNQIKDEFISAISHELRTPLTSMTLAIRMLQEEELTPERQAKYLEVLAQQCQQEILLINDLLGLQQLEENSPLISLERTNIQPILQQLGLTFQQHWTTKALKLKLEIITDNSTAGSIISSGSIKPRIYIAATGEIPFLINIIKKNDISSKTNTLIESDTNLLHSINKKSDLSFSEDLSSEVNTDNQREDLDEKPLSLLPEIYISTHADTLLRILAELLTNAGKYSHPDTIVVLRVEQMLGEIRFSVTNEGAGIPPEEQDLIFEKFHRAQPAVQQAIPGTGLGLALVKPLVKHLRGKITVASSPNPKLVNAKPTSDKPQSWITCFTVKLPQFLDGGKV